MQLAQQENLFSNKLVAAISVGAKRNGGQETTNIFALHEAINLGAFVVGNGPKTSQYGGTAQAGDLGTVLKDTWGLETAYCTGARITQVAKVLTRLPSKSKPSPFRIAILITMDTPERILMTKLRDYVKKARQQMPQAHFTLIPLIEGAIERCLACNICPIPEKLDADRKSYACIIQSSRDRMREIRETMLAADGIILAGLNLRQMADVTFRYQAFTERTRFIRRNDFELTNVPMTSFTLEEVGASLNPLFSLKVMTSYLRHNSIQCPPTREVFHRAKILESGYGPFVKFLEITAFITQRRRIGPRYQVSYKAGGVGGYQDSRLDETQALR